MVFRVPNSPAVTALREELVELEHCHTDQALFNLAIAAAYNGKDNWLATLIEQDQASEIRLETETRRSPRGIHREQYATGRRRLA